MATSRPAGVLRFWRWGNLGTRALSRVNPYWVVLETTGRRSGLPRRIPLARGPVDGQVMSLISVHGERADWVRNIRADPRVRLRVWWRWRSATAAVIELTAAELSRFNVYGKLGPRLFGLDDAAPVLVRIDMSADRVVREEASQQP
ncbi:nitroreductase family deazaflavin-dependent oxidoreductase [Nocardia sp. NPDC019219]|uniref:nitroreductase family deazaflavin-dependent oxidoreductase n=1 Tax=Nocardia TaxID=1817 RepID=UPI00248FB7E9|nr:nitroreductase family deazaflavin-dependent oxidoreductase [Nocardia sputorum]